MQRRSLHAALCTTRRCRMDDDDDDGDDESSILNFFSDFAFHFPHKGTADYIQVWGMPRLTQFTVCSWTQSNDTTPFGTLFSYAVRGQYNEIVISYGDGLKLQINGESRLVIPFLEKQTNKQNKKNMYHES